MVAAYWDKLTTSAFPSIKEDSERREIAEIVREWLQALEEGRATGEQFDQQITGRAMFLFCAMFGAHDRYYPRLCSEIDRRKAMIGFRYCIWRGWVPVHEYDAWRFDRARERAAAPSKFDRER
jgi:hypothetical protein